MSYANNYMCAEEITIDAERDMEKCDTKSSLTLTSVKVADDVSPKDFYEWEREVEQVVVLSNN